MFELNKNEFGKISDLVKKYTDNSIEVMPVIEGNNIGKIFVANIEKPTLALVWTNWEFYILIGEIENSQISKDIKTFLLEKIIPFAKNQNHEDCCLLTYPESLWTDINKELKELYPVKYYRYNSRLKTGKLNYYEDDEEKGNNSPVLENAEIHKMSNTILEKYNDPDLFDDILMHWENLDDFYSKGIGFCYVKDEKIIAFCFSALVAGSIHSINIYTDGEFRKLGLAELLAKKFIKECLLKNLEPSWETLDFNTPSIKLAEKLGFKIDLKLPMYAIYLTEEERIIRNASYYKYFKDFEKTAFFYEKAYKLEKAKNETN